MQTRFLGYIAALFTVMIWSLNLVYSKYLAGIFTPSEISALRWLVATLIMLPIIPKYVKNLLNTIKKYYKTIVLMTFSGVGLQNWCIYSAGYTASATNMALIGVLGPIFLILLSRQKINFEQFFGIILAILGVVFIIIKGSWTNLLNFKFVDGDLYMLASAVLFAIYALIQNEIPKNKMFSMLFMAILTSAIFFFGCSIPEIFSIFNRPIPLNAWIIIFILGIFNSAIAYLTWDYAIKKIGAVDAGLMYYTLPIFTIPVAYFFLNEKFFESQFFGALAVIIGISCVILGKTKIK